MRVWLASYPRSGNTFFRIILSYRYGLPSDGHVTPRESWKDLRRIDVRICPLADPDAPQFVKTHELPGSDSDPAIYLVRDGRDALVSYAHFSLVRHQGLAPGAITPELFQKTLRDLILEQRSDYGTWSRNVDTWTVRPNTVVIKYENLIADPLGTAERALASLGIPLQPVSDNIPTFDELRAIDSSFFRRGTPGGHRDDLPPALRYLFWEHNAATMTRLGYGRNTARKAA
jgi:Sulfotransferase domain